MKRRAFITLLGSAAAAGRRGGGNMEAIHAEL
jgi:hypothetical protein